jgi:hypothetical protein
MEVTTLLDIHTREELYRWYQENHDKVREFWIRSNRAGEDCPGVVRYVDAVEVALCFGWIDSTQKRIDDGKPIQRYSPRRKGGNWCEHNLERCRRLVKLGEMTPAGLAVTPDLEPRPLRLRRLVSTPSRPIKPPGSSTSPPPPTTAASWSTASNTTPIPSAPTTRFGRCSGSWRRAGQGSCCRGGVISGGWRGINQVDGSGRYPFYDYCGKCAIGAP